jgi:hypothetical protein
MWVDLDDRPTRLSELPYDDLEARHFCAWARREAVLGLTPDERRDADFLDVQILEQESLCDRVEKMYRATAAAEMRTLEALVAYDRWTSPSRPGGARAELLEDWWRDIQRQCRSLEDLALQLLPALLNILDLAEVRAGSVRAGWNAMRRLLSVIDEATGLAVRDGTTHREVRLLERLHRQVKGLVQAAQEDPLTTAFAADTGGPACESSTEVRTLDGLGMWACSRLDEVYEITTRMTHLVAHEELCRERGHSGTRDVSGADRRSAADLRRTTARLSELDRLVANGFTQLKMAVRPPRSGYTHGSARPPTVKRTERWSG